MFKTLAFTGTIFTAFSAGAALAQDKPQLTVYTYDSFVAEWGPGPAIKENFEATCDCVVEFVAAGDAAAMLSRLQLEGSATDADVAVGLDTNLQHRAEGTWLFAQHEIEADFDLPIEWKSTYFLSYDWGYFAFVAHDDGPKHKSFEELAASDTRIIIQDPRSSSAGLGLLYWMKDAYGDRAGDVWSELADNIVTVTPGWSEAYGVFLRGEADAVLSYSTSPAYHIIAEEDESKVAWAFDEGHYMQIEMAGLIEGSDQPELAKAFLEYLIAPESQAIFPTTNWMYPAIAPEAGLPSGFDGLIDPQKALLLEPQAAADLYFEALEEWQTALSR